MKRAGRYTVKFRERILRLCDGKTPAEVAEILAEHKVPRTTYLAWKRRWEETGEAQEAGRGRPAVKIRTIVREEIDRGLRNYLGASGPPKKDGK